jgi:dihydroxyacid dehydratase/phosphogluconate dehydratase
MLAAGELDDEGFIKLVASSAPSTGYCNTMGTATTMNSLAEALGMMLPGSAAIPALSRPSGMRLSHRQAHRRWCARTSSPRTF